MSVVPDSIEPIEGWKVLLWANDERELQSPQTRHKWPENERFKAHCNSHGAEHNAPVRDCRCGIYMVDSPQRAFAYAAGHPFVALVRVMAWGRVFPGEFGARAEFAYPAEIFLLKESCYMDPETVAGRIEKLYEVPTHAVSWSEFAAHPSYAADSRDIAKRLGSLRRRSERWTMVAAGVLATQAAINALVGLASGKTSFFVTSAIATSGAAFILWVRRRVRP